jgi:ribosome-associated toxin RatA of RatAB toxin-antitoxin module
MIHTENHVVVNAPLDRVYEIAEDKGRFPTFMPHLLESTEEQIGSRMRFRMAARMKLGFISRWVSERVDAEPGRWAAYHTEGFCRRMEGRWSFEALEPDVDGAPRTRVILTHDFEVGHPVLSLFLPVDRLVTACVRDNSQRMLDAIRDRVEAIS